MSVTGMMSVWIRLAAPSFRAVHQGEPCPRKARAGGIPGASAGVYPRRPESEYGLVRRELPMIAGDARPGRWAVSDMHPAFHFRYVQPDTSFVESGRTDLPEVLLKGYDKEPMGMSPEDM